MWSEIWLGHNCYNDYENDFDLLFTGNIENGLPKTIIGRMVCGAGKQ
jgi:hypothetical protein